MALNNQTNTPGLPINNNGVVEAVSRNRPAEDATVVSPSDSTDLGIPATFLWIGSSGNVKVTTLAGNQVVFTGVPSGTTLWVSVTRVWNTGTTASNIVALHD